MSVTQFQSFVPSVPSSLLPVPPVSVELATSRAFTNNPNHHLWRNGRLWWIAFTLIHDGWRQERIRQSLGTDNLTEARQRRDAMLALFAKSDAGKDASAASDEDGCLDPEGLDDVRPAFSRSFAQAVNG